MDSIDKVSAHYKKFWEIYSSPSPSIKTMIAESQIIEELDIGISEKWRTYQSLNKAPKIAPLYAIYLLQIRNKPTISCDILEKYRIAKISESEIL